MPFQELTKIEKIFIIKLYKNFQNNRCNLNLIEYELGLDKYTVTAIVKKLESKGLVEFIAPQIIRMQPLGEEYIKEHLRELIVIESTMMKHSEVMKEMPELQVYNKVFIIHGHDQRNLLILEKLLKERWQLSPIILRQLPGKGRSMIEKFIEKAEKARYAFAIYTPDDFIEIKDTEYCQARPNTIFELGWFYGNKGRNRVCILCKKGTKIHSDLDGISRIDFVDNMEEKILDIESELKEANLILKEPNS